jgi:hypothetical protein
MAIAFVITCELCGLSVQGTTENQAIDKAADHLEARHPQAADDLTLDRLRERIEAV